MINNLESDYDCSHAGDDLNSLIEELSSLQNGPVTSQEDQEYINRLQNQIHFIRSKCRIH